MAVPSLRPVLLAAALLLGACGGAPSVYRGERFDLDSYFSKRYEAGEELACESVRRALLGAGYTLREPDHGEEVRAIKEYQPDDENNVVLELRASCIPNPDGSATVYASAQQTVNELQTQRQTSNLGIPSVGSLGIPIGSTRSPVKVKSETVQDRAFYRRFFDAVGNQIVLHLRDSLRQGDGAPAPAPVPFADPPLDLY